LGLSVGANVVGARIGGGKEDNATDFAISVSVPTGSIAFTSTLSGGSGGTGLLAQGDDAGNLG
jgi:hypothetical protein